MLSTIAASDDHRSHPGQPHWGIAAVRAPALTRDAIFNALHQRRTYGTTGARILLEFRVNGEPMGGETVTDGAPRLDVAAHGTDTIDSVEILRYSEPDGGFRVIFDLQPDALDAEWSGTDGGFRADASGVRFAVASSWRGRAPSGSAVSPDRPATGEAHLTHDVCQMRFLTIRTGMEIRDCAYWCHAGRDIDALVSPRQNPYPAVAAPATAGVAPRQAARETGCFPTL